MSLSTPSSNIQEQKILCYQGPLIYEAKILGHKTDIDEHDKTTSFYLVHYHGWNKKWDEWVDETRILPWNDENLELQKQVKESYANKNVQSKNHPTESTNNRKRNHEQLKGKGQMQTDPFHGVETQLRIPEPLKCLLVDDWEKITMNHQLVPLPREPNVTQVLAQYKTYALKNMPGRQRDQDLVDEVIEGICMYFNKALGSLLLYQFERLQYSEIRRKYPNKDMTDIYGAEHLLRLYVQLPCLVTYTNLDAKVVSVLADYLDNILHFIQKMKRHFFITEYQNAPPSYISLANGT